MYLGYVETTKGYMVYALEMSYVIVSRYLKLYERKVNGIYESVVPEKSHSSSIFKIMTQQRFRWFGSPMPTSR